MSFALVLILAAGVPTADPLTVEANRRSAAVEIAFELADPLPDEVVATLDAGAETRLVYLLRIKAKRKAWWDRRLWSGRLVAISAFDPVTGRYRCSVVLDGVVTSTVEVETVEAARQWLRAPPELTVELPEHRREADLRVRVRAVFATGTTWLIFPTQDATPWTEVVPAPGDEPADSDG
jgi:hypothetical protein